MQLWRLIIPNICSQQAGGPGYPMAAVRVGRSENQESRWCTRQSKSQQAQDPRRAHVAVEV